MIGLSATSRTRQVGIALEDAQLSKAIAQMLVGTGKYDIAIFKGLDVTNGAWSELPCSVLVTSPATLRQRDNAIRAGKPHSPVVILALARKTLLCHRDKIAFADSFILTDETLPRLPSLIVLSGYGLGIMPRHNDNAVVNPQLRRLKELSGKELQVLTELGRGHTNQTIAAHLGISVANVKARVRNIMQRLYFRNRMEIAVFAALWVRPMS